MYVEDRGSVDASQQAQYTSNNKSTTLVEGNLRLQVPPGPSPLRGPGGVPGECGFVKPSRSQSEWLIREHGAFEINREELGFGPKDQICHQEVWLPRKHVNVRLVNRAREPLFHKRDQSRQPTKKSRSWNPCERMC